MKNVSNEKFEFPSEVWNNSIMKIHLSNLMKGLLMIFMKKIDLKNIVFITFLSPLLISCTMVKGATKNI